MTVWDTQTAAGAVRRRNFERDRVELLRGVWNGSDAYFDGSQGYIYRDQGTQQPGGGALQRPGRQDVLVRPASYTDDAKVNVLT